MAWASGEQLKPEDIACVQAVRECLGIGPLLTHEDRPPEPIRRISVYTVAKHIREHDPQAHVEITWRREGCLIEVRHDGQLQLRHDAASQRTTALLRKVEAVWGRIW